MTRGHKQGQTQYQVSHGVSHTEGQRYNFFVEITRAVGGLLLLGRFFLVFMVRSTYRRVVGVATERGFNACTIPHIEATATTKEKP